ncbi:MAG TPA: TonB-dependent receptor [Pyrinomonadaceae bacterium]|jgi:hypothetical protein
MKSLMMPFGVLLLSFGVFLGVVSGQSDRGSIRGTITDPNGAVVPNAKITITNVETNETRETTTSAEGTYNVPELKAAVYRIQVEAAGFKSATIDSVQVGVQVIRNGDVTLEIGVGASVVVTDEPSVINTESPVQQRNVTEREVRELPLLVGAESGGRSPLSFIFLDSSVVGAGADNTAGTANSTGINSGGLNATNFRINGSQGLGQEILIDGATTRRGENGTFFSEVAPGPNVFQEFTLNTSNYSAEFGNSTGGVISFKIKEGGNDFHGEAYFFHRNESLNANNTRNRILNSTLPENQQIPRPLDRQRDYGFSVSGPVFLPRFGEGTPYWYNGRNRTFFFFNYSAYSISRSETVDVSVPTVRMRNGDFGELLTDPYVLSFTNGRGYQIYNPGPANLPQPFDPALRQPFANNIIPQNLISPVGQRLANLFPLPNQTGPLGSTVFRNYRATSSAGSNTRAYTTKINQVLTDKQQINGSFVYRVLPSTKGGFPRFPGDFVNQGVWDQKFVSYYVRVQHDFTITNNILNHLNLGYNRTKVQNFNFGRGAGRASALGIPVGTTQDLGLPMVGFPGYGDPVLSTDPRAYQTGGSTFFDNVTGDNTYQIADFVTYTRGRHTLRFGADYRRQFLVVDGHFDIGGQFNFRSNQTARTDEGIEGYPIASLLVGRPEFSFNSRQTVVPEYEYMFAAGFVQDDIKVTPKLTLNVGIRYDYNAPRTESQDFLRGFSPTTPNPALGGRLGAIIGASGQGGVQARYRGLVKPDRKAFGPRLGFAYAFNEKTVFRGGWGIYYSPVFYGNGGDGLLGYNSGGNPINFGRDANIDLDTYVPLPTVNPNGQFIGDLSLTQDYYDENFKLGRVMQYDLNVQRQLPFNFVVSLSYIGNRGTRLRSAFNPVNSLPLEALRLGDALLRKKLVDVTPADRAYAASVGFPLPASPDAVYPGFNNQGGNGLLERSVAQALRPFPQYGPINNRLESQGQSFYNAGKIDVQRRFSQGIQFGASYTFSKLITDAASDLYGGSALTGVLQNPEDRRSLRSISPDDVPHNFVFNYLIELPFGKGKPFLNQGGIVDRLVGGWQLGGIHRYRSGTPITVFIAGGPREFLDLVGWGGNLRPNLTGQPFFAANANTGDPNTFRYLNLGAFSAPPRFAGTSAPIGSPEYAAYYSNPVRFLGTAAPTFNDLRTRPFYTEDLSIIKKTRITETTYFEIRAEFFNLLNRSRPSGSEANLDNPGIFGNVGYFFDLDQPRRIQLGARFVF